MEEKNYNWLLSEFVSSKVSIKILETGICRGSKVLDWYGTDPSGFIIRKPLNKNSRTKNLLNTFLDQRLPLLEQYNPDKVICYLYHHKGRRIVSPKDTIELAENQLHGLQVNSIHMALSSAINYYEAYRMTAWNKNNELKTELMYGKFSKDFTEIIKDPVICDKAINVTLHIADFLSKVHKKYIQSIKIDLIPDNLGHMFILKVIELVINDISSSNYFFKGLIRSGTIKDQSSEDISIEDTEYVSHLPIRLLDREHKKKEYTKIYIKKPNAKNTPVFLKMIAKTFERERKAIENKEILKFTKQALSQENTIKRKNFQMKSLRSFNVEKLKTKSINSVNDLLYYLEKTRPRIWVKDSDKPDIQGLLVSSSTKHYSQAIVSNSFAPSSTTQSHKKVVSPNAFNTHRLGHQQKIQELLMQEEKRLKLKISEQSSRVKFPIYSRKSSFKSRTSLLYDARASSEICSPISMVRS
jgi:hypothetical protein